MGSLDAVPYNSTIFLSFAPYYLIAGNTSYYFLYSGTVQSDVEIHHILWSKMFFLLIFRYMSNMMSLCLKLPMIPEMDFSESPLDGRSGVLE